MNPPVNNTKGFRRVNDKDLVNMTGVGAHLGNWQILDFKKFIHSMYRGYSVPSLVVQHKHFPQFCSVLDLDFRFKEETKIKKSEIINYAEKLREIVKEVVDKDVEILITRKQTRCYPKQDHWASGCHMYMTRHTFNRPEMTKIRKLFLDFLPEKLNFNGKDDIVDMSVFPYGENGIFVIGAKKPGSELYHRPIAIVGDEVKYCNFETMEDYKKVVEEAYFKLIFCEDNYRSPKPERVAVPKEIKVAKKKKTDFKYPCVSNELSVLKEDWDFDLMDFWN